jgi:hypothetical protein
LRVGGGALGYILGGVESGQVYKTTAKSFVDFMGWESVAEDARDV